MSGQLVLIVEDDERNRKLVRDVLLASEYRIIETGTGEDALVLAASHEPDLIIMDNQLPGMDGISAMNALQRNAVTKMIPVIALTASAMPEDGERMMAAGFRAYRPKPITVQELLSVVKEVLEEG